MLTTKSGQCLTDLMNKGLSLNQTYLHLRTFLHFVSEGELRPNTKYSCGALAVQIFSSHKKTVAEPQRPESCVKVRSDVAHLNGAICKILKLII